eukprot:ANDGO_05526.mRNA.1 CSC1-like protein At4g35870
MDSNTNTNVDNQVTVVLVFSLVIFLGILIVFFVIIRRLRWKAALERQDLPQPKSYADIQKEILNFFTLPRVHTVLRDSGHEAAVYLTFQKCWMIVLVVVSSFTLGVLIPVHMRASREDATSNGTQSVSDSWFASLSISRVSENTDLLWVHAVLMTVVCTVTIAMVVFFQLHPVVLRLPSKTQSNQPEQDAPHAANKSANSLIWYEPPDMELREDQVANLDLSHVENDVTRSLITRKVSGYSLMFHNLPAYVANDEDLRKFVLSVTACSSDDITSCRLVYDVRNLIDNQRIILNANRKMVLANGEMYRRQWKAVREGKIPDTVSPPKSFEFDGVFPFIHYTNTFEYWKKQKSVALAEFRRDRLRFEAEPKPSSRGFVMFRDHEIAKRVRNASNLDLRLLIHRIDFAPEPNDIKWKFICISRQERILRFVGVQSALILMLLFFSTPIALAAFIQSFISTDSLTFLPEIVRSLLLTYLPSLIVFIAAQLLPLIIRFLTVLEGNYTYSRDDYNVLVRIYVYLILSTLVLPAIAVTAIDTIQEYLSGNNVSDTFRRAFLPQSQVLFFSYLVQQAFIGNAMQLLRPLDLLRGFIIRLSAVFSPEEAKIKRERPEFMYSVRYPSTCAACSIGITYAIIVPLMLPVALVFITIRHLVDRFNITHVYKPGDPSTFEYSIYAYRQKLLLVARLFSASAILLSAYMFLYFSSISAFPQAYFSIAVLVFVSTVVAVAFNDRRVFKRVAPPAPTLQATDKAPDDADLRLAYIFPLVLDLPPYSTDASLRKVAESTEHKTVVVHIADQVRTTGSMIRANAEESGRAFPIELRQRPLVRGFRPRDDAATRYM